MPSNVTGMLEGEKVTRYCSGAYRRMHVRQEMPPEAERQGQTPPHAFGGTRS